MAHPKRKGHLGPQVARAKVSSGNRLSSNLLVADFLGQEALVRLPLRTRWEVPLVSNNLSKIKLECSVNNSKVHLSARQTQAAVHSLAEMLHQPPSGNNLRTLHSEGVGQISSARIQVPLEVAHQPSDNNLSNLSRTA